VRAVSQIRQGREGPLALARAALAGIEASRSRVDDLNVYPVPDGDTGTNMAETVRAAVTALERDPNADVARAVLMGARGNSGVILSQLVRGAVEALADAGGVDARVLAAALRRASETADTAVRSPQEGTILTVARAVAERAAALAANESSLEDALTELVAAGETALARTPEQLDILREAGVVDAGAAGFVEILRGIAAHVRGEPLPEVEEVAAGLPLEAVHQELSRYRYCTTFFVEGEQVDPDRLEADLSALGDSLLVVGSRGAVKAHVHTDDPGRALSLATAVGVLAEIDIKNMHAQTVARTERLTPEAAVSGLVAVSLGEGNRRLFESLGAVCVDGGRSMSPTTADLAAAIDAHPAADILVLPNDRNAFAAAEEAARSSPKRIRVVATRTLQAGLGAAVAFEGSRSAEQNAAEMDRAAAAVRSGAVTRAHDSATIGGLEVEQGQFLGLVDGEPVTSGPVLEPVAREVVERLLGEASDVLTVLLGEGVDSADELVAAVRDAHPELEIEVHEGGQPRHPLLFAVE
jgi:DAK2 domain fusion protein YloV